MRCGELPCSRPSFWSHSCTACAHSARQNVDGDQTSRREPFRPKVPRAKSVPDVRRRPEKMSVHEHLYASREQFVDIKSTLAEREEQKRWTEGEPHGQA